MDKVNETSYIEEDEIDLKELFQTILNGKKIILSLMLVIVSITLIYALKIPNVYKSEAVLIPTESKSSGLGGLGGLAAMAGISIGGGGSMTPDVAFNSLLNNYEFMKKFVIKNKILEHYNDANFDKNYVFAANYRGVYDLFKKDAVSKIKENDYDAQVFNIVKMLQRKFSILSDKKSGLIIVGYSDNDRTYPPIVIESFLIDASNYLVKNNLRIINNKLGYFEKELALAESFELRQSISSIVSGILKEKIMMKSKTYYQCDVLTQPSVSYVKAKVKPKRALILIVSFVTSIILGIFLVFFLEFIKKDETKCVES